MDPSLPVGIRHLELMGCPSQPTDIAGLPVVHVDDARSDQHVTTRAHGTAPNAVPPAASSSSGQASRAFELEVVGVDHVVVLADDVRSACTEIERASGAPLKRVKESDRGVQGFHRLGNVILEVVERRVVEPQQRSSVATYWGFVIVVADLDAAARHLGPDVIGTPKNAVQEGRQIATVRSGAGLGVPLALMSA